MRTCRFRAACAGSVAIVAAVSGPTTASAQSLATKPAGIVAAVDAPWPHRRSTTYTPGDPGVPDAVAKALAEARTDATAGRQRWRVEPAALVRLEPSPLSLDRAAGLPVGNLRAVTIASDGAVWAGGAQGVVRFRDLEHPWDRWQYYGGRRYLPANDVEALAPGEDGSVWVRTSAGIARLWFEPVTLAEKAVRFEARVQARHTRHGLISDSTLAVPGDVTTSHQYPSDNDGLWTAIYAAAQCYRWAGTRDADALSRARLTLRAMLRLEAITGRSGFPARSLRHENEPRHDDGEWHWTSDGEWEWKGDTSSDELDGHFFAFAVAHDLLPDEDLKRDIRRTVARIADHLIENGYNLLDLDGQPTRWGRYSPAYFETDEGREEQGLRSAQFLSHVLVAAHVTGDERFRREYRRLLDRWRYHERVTTYLKYRLELNFSDEELAMLAYLPLIAYEPDPALRAQYRAGVAEWWQNIRREDNPLWNLMIAVMAPDLRPSVPAALRTLRQLPLDLITWTITNEGRFDVPRAPALDRHGRTETTRLLAPDERRVQRWNGNPFQIEGGNGGRGEDDGAAFLLPYWMARYYGFLAGP